MNACIWPLAIVLVLTGCVSRPSIQAGRVSALTTPATFIDERGRTLSANGFIRLDFSADVDLFKLAASESLSIHLDVRTCHDDVELSYWPRPLPAGEARYVALIDVKVDQKDPYNLIQYPQDICVGVKFGSMNPLQNVRSLPVRVSVPDDVLKSLEAFERDGRKSEIFYHCPAPQCRTGSAQD